LFRRGFIPGPHESEETFLKRVESRPPLLSPEWHAVAPQLLSQCGFSIDWVPIVYSSKRLFPWEGAVFWTQESGQPLIQLRPTLQTKQLWGNSRAEILVHEAIHAARESFDQPQFEEFLAYAASTVSWKRWLGPLFTRPWEFPLFALSIFSLPFFPWVAAPLLTLFLGKSFYNHYLFHDLKKSLPFPVLLCLTDREIKEKTISKTPLSPRLQLIEALRKELS
jgi:hypothetical protein